MGVKTRLLDRLEGAIAPLLAAAEAQRPGEPVLLDLFAGTGVVGARLAERARVVACDVQAYAAVLAASRLLPVTGLEAALRAALGRAARARTALQLRYAQALARERALLPAAAAGGTAGGRPRSRAAARAALVAYRRAVLAEAASHQPECEVAARDADGFPPCLLTAYYRNVYFGVEQAIELDALRYGIEGETEPRRRQALLAALLYAASRATSATAHFAQPRALGRLREVRALARRRTIQVRRLFVARARVLAAEAEQARLLQRSEANEVHCVEYRQLLARWGERRLDVVYADPPYTADNYSRFYHVLETLVRYDYPPLERRGGRLLKGRYPVRARRHQSRFCSPATVEQEFRTVCGFAAGRGAALVWSYSASNGLLVRACYGGRLEPLRALLREYFGEVRLQRCRMRHSGAGSRNHDAEELIAVCTRPHGPLRD
ncbi:MAG: hypothetical protein KatS3mg102_2739 [Planctomycetota bacterium]|nr:MAG: hypothetical protein KatS3mg102_2739 [Planctomycetota bacterium]